MGIFDKLLGREAKLTPKAAFVLSAMTVIGADGQIDEEEFLYLRRLVKNDQAALDLAVKVFKNIAPKDCIPTIAATLDDKQKRTVMANLIDLAMSDGEMAGKEKEMLLAYMAEFKVAEAEMKGVIDAIALKNDMSVFK